MMARKLGSELALWRIADALRGVLEPPLLGEFLCALLFLKSVSSTKSGRVAAPRIHVPHEASFQFLLDNCEAPGNASRLNIALLELERANPDILNKLFTGVELDSSPEHEQGAYNKSLGDALRLLGSVDLQSGFADRDVGRAYEMLLSTFPRVSFSNAGEHYTPAEVSKLMSQLVDPRPGDSIYDPVCGSAGLLLTCANTLRDRYNSHEYTLYGQDINPSSWRVSVLNAYFHGEDVSHIKCGDTLRGPLHLEGPDKALRRFDVILANPPFSIAHGPWDDLIQRRFGRFKGERPLQGRLDYAFILHMIESMDADTGRVITIAPHGVLFRGGSDGDIRRKLIESNLVEAIIGLPPKLFYATAIPAVILCLRAKRKDDHVLFIDASRDFAPGRRRNELRTEDIERILTAVKERAFIPGYARRVSAEEIAASGFSLNIARYLAPAPRPTPVDFQSLAQRQQELEVKLGTVRHRIQTLLQQLIPDPGGVSPLLSLPVREFCQSVKTNQLVAELERAYVRANGSSAARVQRDSWTESLPRLADVLELCDLPATVYIGLEARIPHCSARVDFALYGHDSIGRPSVVLVEAKRWSEPDRAAGDGLLLIRKRTGLLSVLHPSLQVQGYRRQLASFVKAFQSEPPVQLASCAYAPNCSAAGPLLDAQFADALAGAPVFCALEAERLAEFVQERVGQGGGAEVLARIRREGLAPTKVLIEQVPQLMRRQDVFNFLDEQIPAHRSVVAALDRALRGPNKSIILVEGGPGTGKSTIALDAFGRALRDNQNAFFVSGSNAFADGMHRLLGAKRSSLVRATEFLELREENSVDMLIVDEAHRIPAESPSGEIVAPNSQISQLDALVRASRVTALFMDSSQIVEPDGGIDSDQVVSVARRLGVNIERHRLEAQFRCDGSEAYLEWVDELFGLTTVEEPRALRNPWVFDFDVLDSPHQVLEWIRERNRAEANSARLTAGWCWPWSDPETDGTLVNDIVIGDFVFPWELKYGLSNPRAPEARYWAVDPAGTEQAGMVYSVQGFEFRHVGVLMGPDLVIRGGRWVANPTANFHGSLRAKSPNGASLYLRRIYRTLFTRALRSVRVYSVDEETQEYIRSRLISPGFELLQLRSSRTAGGAGGAVEALPNAAQQ